MSRKHVACTQFRANFWRPTICAYCYCPKVVHSARKTADRANAGEGRRAKSFGSVSQLRIKSSTLQVEQQPPVTSAPGDGAPQLPPRSASISSSSPTRLRERQWSEPPRSPEPPRAVPEQPRQVGVVKPYAVVDITTQQWRKISAQLVPSEQHVRGASSARYDSLPRRTTNTLPRHHGEPATGRLARFASCTSLHDDPPPQRRRIVPKRKAPPPPNRPPARLPRAISVPSKVNHLCRSPAPAVVKGGACTAPRPSRKSPPRKPPRTQSTFLSDISDLLAGSSASESGRPDSKYYTLPPPSSPEQHEPNDYEPLITHHAAAAVTNDKTSVTMIPHRVVEVFDSTLAEVATCHMMVESHPHIPWEVEWAELTMCTDELGQQQLYYHNTCCIAVEPRLPVHNTELQIAQSIPGHINLALARGVLDGTLPDNMVDMLPQADHYIVRDTLTQATLRDMIPQWRRRLDEEQYVHTILIVLVQVLQGLNHLYRNGVTHRDISPDTILVEERKEGCLIKIGGFHYALHHPGPVTATTFIYAFNELHWLGGCDACLPPEIMDTQEHAQTLNYAHTDCFAVGCLIYELMTGENPFEQDSHLVYTSYHDNNLPPFPQRSQGALNLHRLAVMLVRRETSRRLSIQDALVLMSAMLWLPAHWLLHLVTSSEVYGELLMSKANMLAQLASRKNGEAVVIEQCLRAQFLSSSSATDIVRTIAVFTV